MTDRNNPDSESRESPETVADAPLSPTRRRISANMKAYWNDASVKLAKRTIRTGLKSAPTETKASASRFRDVIEKRPAQLSEILDCLESDRRLERLLGSAMFRAWIVDPADVSLHRLALAHAILTEARRIEGRSSKRAIKRPAFEAMLLQASARLSPRHAPFYADYYLSFGEASVEKAPTEKKLSAELHKRAGWLPEALAMLTGLHRMHNVARDESLDWAPSLLKAYRFAYDCTWKANLVVFGQPLNPREKARGKKTIEDNLSGKSLAPCIWYSALGYRTADGIPLSDIIGDLRVDLSAYVPDLILVLERAQHLWETIALAEYRARCGPAKITLTQLPFDADKLSETDEKLIRAQLGVRAGRPRKK